MQSHSMPFLVLSRSFLKLISHKILSCKVKVTFPIQWLHFQSNHKTLVEVMSNYVGKNVVV